MGVHVYDLPVAPVFEGVAPEPVEDTPEVAAAKAEFQAAFDAAANREKRSTPAATTVLPAAVPYAGFSGLPYAAGLGYAGYPYAAGLGYAGYGYAAGFPYAHGFPYAAPVAVAAAPAVVAAAPAAAPAAVVASAPAVRDAVKLVIKNNPGFAESYIVQ